MKSVMNISKNLQILVHKKVEFIGIEDLCIRNFVSIARIIFLLHCYYLITHVSVMRTLLLKRRGAPAPLLAVKKSGAPPSAPTILQWSALSAIHPGKRKVID